ncbi:hypothetical protein LZC95_50730 [Pendulispora brunnea]|uniref:Fimbrillin family protein n=1 Tax=Pendulispora brunnea TaxID=2905690 RepID=A0ABZ2K7L5_9BACT
MKIHAFVGWGMGFIGLFGIAACGASDGKGDSQAQSPLVADDEERTATVDFVGYNHKGDVGYSAAAEFIQGRLYGPGAKETRVKEGSCTITNWQLFDREDPEHPPVFVSAGEIALSGAKLPPNSVMKPTDNFRYPYFYGTELLWTGGEDIRIAAAGSPRGVGAFDATLKAPSHITVTKPSLDDIEAIDRSKDLELAWTNLEAASGTVWVTIEAIDEGFQGGVNVKCEYPASLETAKVPASTLRVFPVARYGSMLIESAERQTVTVPPWKVNVALRAEGTRAESGRGASVSVKFL